MEVKVKKKKWIKQHRTKSASAEQNQHQALKQNVRYSNITIGTRINVKQQGKKHIDTNFIPIKIFGNKEDNAHSTLNIDLFTCLVSCTIYIEMTNKMNASFFH